MVRTMQFTIHIPLMQLILPPNVMMLYRNILPVVCWDLLDGWVTLEDLGFS
jgi:hypothetical protein